MNTPLTYNSVLGNEPSPAQIADDVRTALREYSAGQVYEIRDAADLARLIKESDDAFDS
jgi:hypothetical protein